MYKKISIIASAVVWVLLPKCSACLMAYMGLFSAMGLGQMVNHPQALLVIKLLLAVNLFASLYLAVRKKQYLFAIISLACALVFIVNKIYLESVIINIFTGVVLAASALWVRLPGVRKRQCLFNEHEKKPC
ncbi:MAG: hypothetical protein JWM28_2158 [Chitinophagaceae bacterium]|nr:hypothetical protein [Chitinophagaceae bacterium]